MSELEYALHLEKTGKAQAQAAKVVANKRSKHGNVKVEHDGVMFDSKHELKCWLALLDRQARGEISDLKRQVSFELAPAVDIGEKRKKRAMVYIADATFQEDGALVVLDAKSRHTRTLPEYRQKKHFMAWIHKIIIREA
jgi:hypothetical protein